MITVTRPLAPAPEPTATTRVRSIRYVGKCRYCKAVATVDGYKVLQSAQTRFGPTWKTVRESWPELSCDCPRVDAYKVGLRQIVGVVNPDHKCDARCVNAKGHNCECACGGKNHGTGYSL